MCKLLEDTLLFPPCARHREKSLIQRPYVPPLPFFLGAEVKPGVTGTCALCPVESLNSIVFDVSTLTELPPNHGIGSGLGE